MSRLMMGDIVLSVLGKISNPLMQQSTVLLGVEHQIHSIETNLRKNADLSNNMVRNVSLREIVYDLEDLLDDLLIKTAQRKNMDALFWYILALVDRPLNFFSVLCVFELLDHYILRRKLEVLNLKILSAYAGLLVQCGWHNSSKLHYDEGVRSTIISPVISLFESLATQKYINYRLRSQARWLRDEFRSLSDFVKIVESNELSDCGMVWIERLVDVCRSSENVVELFVGSRRQKKRLHMQNVKAGGYLKGLVWSPLDFISQHRFALQLSRIKDIVTGLSENSNKAVLRLVSPGMLYGSGLRLRCVVDQPDVISFEEDVNAVTSQLLEDDPRCLTVSIVGTKGIGKTSLLKLIYDSQAIIDHFPYRTWVSKASDFEVFSNILNATNLDLHFDHRKDTRVSYRNRVKQILNAFCKDKKYLIVVDEVCRSSFWNASEIESAFSDISNGTRILFTFRTLRQAPPATQTSYIYRLHLRNYDESWSLFTYNLKVDITSEMQKLKEPIIRKCGGLPEVITKLKELLRQKPATLEEWSHVLGHLNHGEPWSEVLEEINKYLPLYLRRCLFYFGLFPADYKIPARRLIALWVAEGLGRHRSDEMFPEHVAKECLRELINCDMVQVVKKKLDGEIKTCWLPEILQVHWISKAKETNFLQGHSDSRLAGAGAARRIADHLDRNDVIFDYIHGSRIAPLYPCYRDVVTFLSFDTREGSSPGDDIGSFLDRCISRNCFQFLWVLDLENVYKPKLPKAASQLTRLRYLGLRSTYLEMLPVFFNKFLNLQTLDLKRTCINTLPSSMWKMQKLRHLILEESYCSNFAPKQEADGSLEELQTLWGAIVNEYSPVRNGLDTLLNITKLGLRCRIAAPSDQEAAMSSQLLAVANWVQNLKKLQCLRLKSFDKLGQPWTLHLESLSGHVDLSSIYLVGKLKNQHLVAELPQSLVELTLSASELVDDPMQPLGKLPNLRVIKLLSRSFIGKKMLCSRGGFPKLEILRLWELELLEEWNAEEGALLSLKTLEIRRCNNLKMLPDALLAARGKTNRNATIIIEH